jgi:hypothetical protein
MLQPHQKVVCIPSVPSTSACCYCVASLPAGLADHHCLYVALTDSFCHRYKVVLFSSSVIVSAACCPVSVAQSLAEQPERPVIEKFEDELDQWGRPKRRMASPIDAMPEDAQGKAYEQLEQQLAKEARRQQQEQQQ